MNRYLSQLATAYAVTTAPDGTVLLTRNGRTYRLVDDRGTVELVR